MAATFARPSRDLYPQQFALGPQPIIEIMPVLAASFAIQIECVTGNVVFSHIGRPIRRWRAPLALDLLPLFSQFVV
jgi:hypothetical protein